MPEILTANYGIVYVLTNPAMPGLVKITQELLGLEYSVQPTQYWTYNGRNLTEIYNDTYSREED